MRQSRFTEEQMVSILREADRDPVGAVAKRHGISEQTIYTWRKRFGYRRIKIFLGRDGHVMGFGRAWRLWHAAGLQVPRKRPRKRIKTGRSRPLAPTGPNQVWTYDFVFDRSANNQQLKCLTIADEWTMSHRARSCLCVPLRICGKFVGSLCGPHRSP